MGKKQTEPVVGNRTLGSEKRSRQQIQSPYVYHWDRIIGALVVVSVLVGLTAYGIHSLFSPGDPEQIETADTVWTQTLSDEKQRAAHREGRIEPAYVAAESAEPRAPQESAATPPTTRPGDSELPAATIEDLAQATDIAVDDEAFKRSTGPGEQAPSQSQHGDVDKPGVAEAPPRPQQEDNENPPAAVEDVAYATGITVDDDRGVKQSTGPAEQTLSQPQHRDVDTPSIAEVEEKKAIFSLIAKRLSSPVVKRFELAKSVENKKPIGDIDTITPDSRGVATVYAFSDVGGMRQHSIYYHWFLDGQRVAKVRVGIGADRWRSHSSKIINESMKGTWRVELQDREGQVLASADFVY